MVNDRKDRVFFAATMIVTKQVTADKTHASPVLVKQAVDLAEMLVDEVEQRELAIEEAPAEPPKPAAGP